jgi:hypothetical protein
MKYIMRRCRKGQRNMTEYHRVGVIWTWKKNKPARTATGMRQQRSIMSRCLEIMDKPPGFG